MLPSYRLPECNFAFRTLIITALVTSLFAAGCGSGGSQQVSLFGTVSGGTFGPNQQGATYTVIVSNLGTVATSGTVTVTAPPTGFTVTAVTGTGWTCAAPPMVSCSRSDSLAGATIGHFGGPSFPTITVTGNVTATAGQTVSIPLSVSGGGSAATMSTSSYNVVAAVLSITKTHTGNFSQGQQNAAYTVTVSDANSLNAGPTVGTVTVTETVPSGLTLASMTGSGWTCTVSPTCTRMDTLVPGAFYPPITVTVNVGASATSPQINQVSVSGGGSQMAPGSDSTIITASNGGPAIANGSDSTTITDPNSCAGTGTGNESLLNGQYAILLQGFQGQSYNTPVAIAASFTADGNGGITGGEEDINNATAPQHFSIVSGSSYTVGSDNRGCLLLTYTGGTTTTFRFTLGGVSGGVASNSLLNNLGFRVFRSTVLSYG